MTGPAEYRAAAQRLETHVRACEACKRRGARAELAKPGSQELPLEQLLCERGRPLWAALKHAAGIPSAAGAVVDGGAGG